MRFVYFIIISFVCVNCFSQDDYTMKPPHNYEVNPAKTALFIELGGNAGLYSLNADRIYYYKPNFKLSARVGISAVPQSYYIHQTYVIEQNVILFQNPHHLECGVGVTLQRQYNGHCTSPNDLFWESIWYGTARLGYRYQKQEDGFFLKTGITPAISQKSDCGFDHSYFQLWFGVAVGVSF